MILKITTTLLALAVGGWMIFDGIHVLLMGKYFGPEKPGPWSDLVAAAGLNPFNFGIPFIALGVLWLVFHFAFLMNRHWAWYAALLTAVLTLWYAPVGTLISVVYIILLLVFRKIFKE